MDKLKQMLEAFDMAPVKAHFAANYGKYAVGALTVVAVIVGLYLGYDVNQIMTWLGQ